MKKQTRVGKPLQRAELRVGVAAPRPAAPAEACSMDQWDRLLLQEGRRLHPMSSSGQAPVLELTAAEPPTYSVPPPLVLKPRPTSSCSDSTPQAANRSRDVWEAVLLSHRAGKRDTAKLVEALRSDPETWAALQERIMATLRRRHETEQAALEQKHDPAVSAANREANKENPCRRVPQQPKLVSAARQRCLVEDLDSLSVDSGRKAPTGHRTSRRSNHSSASTVSTALSSRRSTDMNAMWERDSCCVAESRP